MLIAVKKSCSDTREKCVFMEKARDIAMDLENPLKLTTEGKQFLYPVLSKLVKYRLITYTLVTFYKYFRSKCHSSAELTNCSCQKKNFGVSLLYQHCVPYELNNDYSNLYAI